MTLVVATQAMKRGGGDAGEAGATRLGRGDFIKYCSLDLSVGGRELSKDLNCWF